MDIQAFLDRYGLMLGLAGAAALGGYVLFGRKATVGGTVSTPVATLGGVATGATGGASQIEYVPTTGDTFTNINETNSGNTVEAGGTLTQPTSGDTTTSTVTPAPVVVVTPVVTPTPPPPPPPPIMSAQPWWYGYLHGGAGAAPNQHTYWTSTGQTPVQLARMFHLLGGWTDIAYNPHNSALTHDSYVAHGNNIIPAGTEVWVTTSTISPSSTGLG